jgi:hypothetical protein
VWRGVAHNGRYFKIRIGPRPLGLVHERMLHATYLFSVPEMVESSLDQGQKLGKYG